MSKQELLSDIVAFLNDQKENSGISNDEKESLELAIDCIKETFKINEDAAHSNLLEIYQTQKANKTTTHAPKQVSEQDIAAADELKAQGNKLMAARDFQKAVDAYTKAIELNPHNAMYYSNRAAAYSFLSLPERAVDDATKAIEVNPKFSKGYSRLGHALWSQGNIQGAYDAYAKGLEVEGDSPSDGMKRDFENVKRRLEEMSGSTAQSKSTSADAESASDAANSSVSAGADTGSNADSNAGSNAGGGPGGFPDMSSLAGLMNNPQMKAMANQFMSNPEMLSGLMNSPIAQKIKQGGMPGMGDIAGMMQDENIQKMMKGFGGAGGPNAGP